MGVIVGENTKNYFFRWNEYIIEELSSIQKIISHDGIGFLLDIVC